MRKLLSIRPRFQNFWFLFLFVLLLVGSRAGAQATFAAEIDNSEQAALHDASDPNAPPVEPGTTDPQGGPANYMMFADHELYVPTIPGVCCGVFAHETDYPDATLGITESVSDDGDWGITVNILLYAKRGRVTRQDRDQIIGAHHGNDSMIDVFLATEPYPNQIGGIPDSFSPYPNQDFIALAVGDLDKVPDSAGNNHDEVVVAYTTTIAEYKYAVHVEVLNYTRTANVKTPICRASANASIGIDSLKDVKITDTVLDVAVADFDGNGKNEIAVTYLQNAGTLMITTFKYTFDGSSSCALTEAFASVNPLIGTMALGSLQTDVGDIDGNGVVDLIVAQAVEDSGSDTQFVTVNYYAGNQNLNLQTWDGENFDPVPSSIPLRVQVQTGLYIFDPGQGVDFNHRDILLGWTSDDQTISVQGFSWSASLHGLEDIGDAAQFSPYLTDQSWSIAAGSFKGVLAPQDPRWSAVFYGTHPQTNNASYYLFDVATPQDTKRRDVSNTTNNGSLLPIVAFDADGNSLFLGAPIHIVADDTVTTDYIIYEPPKHTFYNIDTSNEWGYPGQIVNLSRYSDFNVTFTKDNSSSVSTSSTQAADWTIGGSEETSASGTVKAGLDLGFTADNVKTTLGLSETVSYSHNQQNKKINSSYQTQSVQYSTTTSADDSVGGSTQDLDIWRYRIYGLPSQALGSYPAAYYDYYIPSKKIVFSGNSGLDLDWYQPLHENGNLLSYPLANNNTFQPNDVGTIVVNGTTLPGTLVPASQITCCGNSGHEELEFTGSVAKGSEFSSSNTWNESVDFTAAYSAKVSAFGNTVKLETSSDLNFNNSNSSSASNSTEKTTTVGEAITLNYSDDATGFGYLVYPVMHTTPDGTFKISQAVQFLPTSQTAFWDDYYGHKPDPALNLPHRFYETTFSNNPTWAPTQDSSRKTIRGFNLLNGTKGPLTHKNDALPLEAVPAGAPLLVQVNLYNYSTGGITNQVPTNANNLQVLFQYAPINGAKETGPRVNIGTITVPQVAPMQIVPAQIAWNTAGLGGSGSCVTQQYRIIVTLDPNNTIDEIYEAENPNTKYPYVVVDPLSHQPKTTYLDGIDPGQNNQGYGYATVQTPNPNGDCSPGNGADVSLKPHKSLGAVDAVDHKLHSDKVTALRNKPLRLRLKVFSNRSHDLYGHVLIYDGNPRDGAPLIADKAVHFGNLKGAVVWFDWIPRTGGKHELFAKLVQKRGDPVQDNGRAFVEVEVVKKINK